MIYAALKYAVREGRLSANPLDTVTDRDWRPPEVDQAVDPRRVANPAQMRALLEAIGSIGLSQGPRLVALYGCMYYGMLRPSEAVSLRADNCYLPGDLERQISAFVEHYNHVRYHESLSNLTPADVYFGRADTILAERERIKRATIANRRLQHQLQAA